MLAWGSLSSLIKKTSLKKKKPPQRTNLHLNDDTTQQSEHTPTEKKKKPHWRQLCHHPCPLGANGGAGKKNKKKALKQKEGEKIERLFGGLRLALGIEREVEKSTLGVQLDFWW